MRRPNGTRPPAERERARVYAERSRDKKWRAQAMKQMRCARLLSRNLRCNERLTNRLVGGVTVPFCARCDCKRRGVCVDCRVEPVVGTVHKAIRCARCKRLAQLDNGQRYAKRHPGKIRAQWRRRRKRLRENGGYEAMLERKKLWRLANPKAKARYAKAYNGSAHALEYQRARRLRIGAEKRAQEKERARLRKLGIEMTHPCHDCGAPITGRPKKCTTCKARAYRAARATLLGLEVAA